MEYFYLVASVFFIASSSIFGSYYNRRNEDKKDPTPLFNVLLAAVALVGWWILYAFDFSINPGSLLYAALFAIGYALADIGIILALATGPVSLTSLLFQLSLIGATIWGFIFWGEKPTPLTFLGLALVTAAIALCLLSPAKQGSDKKPITLKWVFFALMAFFGNMICSISQRTHQMVFDGEHGSMMMAFAMIFSLIVFIVVYFVGDRSDTRAIIKQSWAFPVAAGACNMLLNLFVILLATTTLAPSLVYPVISIGGIMITALFSALVLKEKLYIWQWCGIAVGAAAIVALSI